MLMWYYARTQLAGLHFISIWECFHQMQFVKSVSFTESEIFSYLWHAFARYAKLRGNLNSTLKFVSWLEKNVLGLRRKFATSGIIIWFPSAQVASMKTEAQESFRRHLKCETSERSTVIDEIFTSPLLVQVERPLRKDSPSLCLCWCGASIRYFKNNTKKQS